MDHDDDRCERRDISVFFFFLSFSSSFSFVRKPLWDDVVSVGETVFMEVLLPLYVCIVIDRLVPEGLKLLTSALIEHAKGEGILGSINLLFHFFFFFLVFFSLHDTRGRIREIFGNLLFR